MLFLIMVGLEYHAKEETTMAKDKGDKGKDKDKKKKKDKKDKK